MLRRHITSYAAASLLAGFGLLQGINETAQGAVVLYTFGTGSPSTANLNFTSHDPDVTASAITTGTGLGPFLDPTNSSGYGVSTAGNPPDSFFVRTQSVNEVAPSSTSTNYASFTVTPTASHELNLTSLTFDYAFTSAGSGESGTWTVRTSQDGFANNVGSPVTFTSTSSSTTTSAWLPDTLDLSGPAYQGLTSGLEIRIYFTSHTDQGDVLRVDNITLNGSVAPVPEPASLGVLALGGLGLLARRRQKA